MTTASSPRLAWAPARPMAHHAKLHRRGNSSSSVPEQLGPTSTARPSVSFNPIASGPLGVEGAQLGMTSPDAIGVGGGEKHGMNSAGGSGTPKIKYLRKFASKEDTNMQIDLSRSAAENEGLAGLGISDLGGGYTRSTADGSNSRSRPHGRSTSNASQLSSSSSRRPSAPYVHPMRQTPRPYTPPLSQSFSNSFHDGESSQDAPTGLSEQEFSHPPPFLNPSRRSTSSQSTPRPSPLLRLRTSDSKGSQSSLSQTGPSAMRRDTLRSLDGPAPSGRSSVDRAAGFLRPREEPLDPAERAAQIQAARKAYQERERAKAQRLEKSQAKQAEKENRKRYRQEERQRLQAQERELRAAHPSSADGTNEKTGAVPNEPARDNAPPVSTKRAAISPWIRFATWFRTRLLKLGRKLKLA